jgi:hypothetical protein
MKLDYTIDMEDPENARAVEEVFKDQPDPKVIIDMQQTLARALQPVQMPQTNQAMGPVQASPNWGNNQ